MAILIPKNLLPSDEYRCFYGTYLFLDDFGDPFNPTLFHTIIYKEISDFVDIHSGRNILESIGLDKPLSYTSSITISESNRYMSSLVKIHYPSEVYEIVHLTMMSVSKELRTATGLFNFIKDKMDEIGYLMPLTRDKVPENAFCLVDDFLSYHMNVETNGKYVSGCQEDNFSFDE